MMRAVLALVAVTATAPLASAQSFDCTKAQTGVEKMICASPRLSELDEHLGRYYSAAREAVAGAASCLQSDQSQWLRSARNTCRNDACLETAYLNRLAELDALQPGATAVKNITLPKVPTLVWIVPPALDQAAAPPKPNAKPLEVTGRLVNDVANGDGFVVQGKDAVKVPLVLLMLLEGGTQSHLEGLAKQPNLQFRVRGYAASDGKRSYFEPSRCAFIHRLP